MPSIKTRPNLKKIIAALRLRVAQGDLSEMCDLGMWLQEGFQDKRDPAVIRSNPGRAF
jgi:hypothetical protein